MTGTGGDGPDGTEIGSVRFNDRGELEFYDGTAWAPYADFAVADAEEAVLFRGSDPVVRPGQEDGPAALDGDPEGPEHR
ncbi:hypothetical protein ABZZ79_18215 [Streptomyces sp. NPDC006458]|uniref:hypothetical protein n=1 Tax=Streptomyces sp. NPDC006458 TaxID=3154302 RepID=UPI0033BCDD09